jgi:hypothetical protein
MLKASLGALLICAAALPLAAQTTGYTPPAGTDAMGASNNGGYGGWWPGTGGPLFWRNTYTYGVQAQPNQVRVGDPVYSTEGPMIGRVAYADAHVAVVKSQRWALRLPVKAFGVNKKEGLLLKLSPANFDHLARLHGARAS